MFLRKNKTKKKNKDLKNYTVLTQSGFKLGVVVSVLKDKTTKEILKINVKKTFLKIPFGDLYTIDRTQILKIEDKKVIVSDATLLLKEGGVAYTMENV